MGELSEMTTRRLDHFLTRHAVLSPLSEASRTELLRCSPVLSYRRGDTIWSPGHPAEEFVLVLEGAVGRFLSGLSPRPLFTSIDREGAFADLAASLRGATRTQIALAITSRARVAKIPCAAFRDALGGNTESMSSLLTLLAHDLDAMTHRLAMSTALTSTRLASLLLDLSEIDPAGPRLVTLRITREQMAQYIGATPETVTRTLSAWGAEGIVEKRTRTLVLRDLAKLEVLALGSRSDEARPDVARR